jgi:AcrR family transcriptional regulator
MWHMATRQARQTRAEKQAETRERLLVAAERIAVQHGLARVTLDKVAEAAGLTKGAIYSNFGSKEELLFAVVSRLTPGLNVTDEVLGAPDLATLLERTAAALIRVAGSRSKEVVFTVEFDALALRDTKLRQALRRQSARDTAAGVEEIRAELAPYAREMGLPPEQFLTAVNAVAQGLLLQRMVYGSEAVSDELITWVLRRLGGVRPAD